MHNWTNRPVWPQYADAAHRSRRRSRRASIGTSGWDRSASGPIIRNYTHMVFRGWYDFGGGSMADMGHYSLWTVFSALDLAGPTSVEPMLSHDQVLDGRHRYRAVKNDFSFPSASVVRFKYPARGAAGRGGPDLV